MRSIARILVPVLLLLVAVGSAMADMREDVAAAYQAWDAAFNKADAKAVAAFYVSDGKVLPPSHTVVTGPAEIEKLFAGFFANGVKSHSLKLIEAGGTDKMVYGIANWSAADKDEKPLGGLATHIFERQSDGSLKLKIHTFN